MLTLILVICIVGYILIDLYGDTWKDIWFNIQTACMALGFLTAFFLIFVLIGYCDTINIDERIKIYEDAQKELIETYGTNSEYYYYKNNYDTIAQLKEDKLNRKTYKWLLYFGK